MSLDLETYLQELETIVNIDSPSKNTEGTSKVCTFFAERFSRLGWKVAEKTIDASVGKTLIITNKDAGTYEVLLLGHTDTVFAIDTTATRPFSRDTQRLYGPGVIDMKAGLLYAYHVAKHLTEEKLLGDKAICIIFNSDEEISSPYSRLLIEEWAKKAKYAIVLEPPHINGVLINKRKGILKYFIDFHGIAAHAGIAPELGANAIHELCLWGVALKNMNNPEKGTVVNIGVVSGGTSPNVVADYARLEIDMRVSSMEEATKIEQCLQDMAKNPTTDKVTVTITGGVSRPPMLPTEKSLEFYTLVEEVGKSLGIDITWISTGGGSDASFSSMLGVPTIDGISPIGGNSHSVNEYLEIDSIVPRFNLLLGIIKKILEK